MPPVVSICIINYNYGRFLAAAIDSALGQTWPEVEVVVVDDGSTDRSAEIIDGYGDLVTTVRKGNGGQGSAFNAGFAACSGSLVCFLDADDTLQPELAAAAAKELDTCPELSKVQFMMRLVDRDGVPLGPTVPRRRGSQPTGDLRAHVLRFRNYPWPPSSANVYSACALLRVLPVPEEHYPTYCDSYLAELVPLLGPVRSVDIPAVNYRRHGDNDFLTLGASAAWLRRKIALVELGHENVRRLAGELGVTGVAERATDVRDAAFLGYRLASMRLEPSHHPLPGDRPWALVAQGVTASLTNPLLRWPGRVRRTAWFLLAGLVPGRPGRELAQRWLPDGPGSSGGRLSHRRVQWR